MRGCRGALRLQGGGGWLCGLVAATPAAAGRLPVSVSHHPTYPERGQRKLDTKQGWGELVPFLWGAGCKTGNVCAALVSWLALQAAC